MTSPMRQFLEARRELLDANENNINPVWRNGYAALGWLAKARNGYRRAAIRLALSALAYTVVACAVILIAWALIVLAWAAFGPAPLVTDVQLPTK